MGKNKRKRRDTRDSSSDEESLHSRRELIKRIKKLEEAVKSKRDERRYSREHCESSRNRYKYRENRHASRYSRRCNTRNRSSASSDLDLDEERSFNILAQQEPASSRDSVLPNQGNASSVGPISPVQGDRILAMPSEQEASPQDEDILLLESEDILSQDVLPKDVLELLGEDPTTSTTNVPMAHEAIASRWGHILLKGLPKEIQKDLLNSIILPSNFQLLEPPILNPELLSILGKPIITRDSALAENQRWLGKAIAALSMGLSALLGQDMNKQKVVQLLSNAGRLLCALFLRLSINRRNLAATQMNKEVVDAIRDCPPSNFLFGSELAERVKTAKSLINVGKEFKKTPLKSSASTVNPATRKDSARSLNSKRPVPRQRAVEPSKGRTSYHSRYSDRKQPISKKH